MEDNVQRTLHQLIRVCREGQSAFGRAASSARDPQMRALFDHHAEERGAFASELERQVEDGDVEASKRPPHERRTASGDGNGRPARWARDLRRWLLVHEQHALEEFRDALEKGLPAGVHSTVTRQYARLRSEHEELEQISGGEPSRGRRAKMWRR